MVLKVPINKVQTPRNNVKKAIINCHEQIWARQLAHSPFVFIITRAGRMNPKLAEHIHPDNDSTNPKSVIFAPISNVDPHNIMVTAYK